LYVGVRNTLSLLTTDAFSQTNPPAVATNVSAKVDITLHGVLSGSVAFTRPDTGSDYIGGPGSAAVQAAIQANVAQAIGYRVLGVFENSAAGNAYENTPGVASGRGPHVTAMGSFGNKLYETALIGDAVGGDPAAGAAITYVMGIGLIASRNGYLTPNQQLNAAGAAIISCDDVTISAEAYCRNTDNISTLIGVVKMVPDATQTELVYDQRI
jgi:hypothetical protein